MIKNKLKNDEKNKKNREIDVKMMKVMKKKKQKKKSGTFWERFGIGLRGRMSVFGDFRVINNFESGNLSWFQSFFQIMVLVFIIFIILSHLWFREMNRRLRGMKMKWFLDISSNLGILLCSQFSINLQFRKMNVLHFLIKNTVVFGNLAKFQHFTILK